MTDQKSVSDLKVPADVDVAETVFSGAIFDVVRETITLPGADSSIQREYMEHPGAVGIVVLNDQDEVLVQKQRRQPVRAELWEVPAGLLDVKGEAAVDAARRELSEEADLIAQRWHVLADHYMSPGCSSEAMRIFLARDLTATPEAERHQREDEEALLVPAWVPFKQALTAVLEGRIGNPTTVVGLLSLAAHRASNMTTLRNVDTPWPARPEHV